MFILNLKNLFKTFPLFYKIFDSRIYSKLRSNKRFKERLEEIMFYKEIIGAKVRLIFDVGANVGNKSIVFSEISEKIVLFEPDFKSVKMLRARFKNKSKFIIVQSAIGSKVGDANYYSISNDSAYNSLSEKHMNTVVKNRNIVNNHKVKRYTVKTNTLNDFIKEYGRPYYLKIDVEGYEKEVLLGLNEIIPVISFEANIPEFLSETIDIIDYLKALSLDNYLYNYSVNNKLESINYLTADKFKDLVCNLNIKSLEVFCKLKT